MGFFGGRGNRAEVRPEQKWDYISLNDFKSNSCWAPFAYGYLWFSLVLSIAVYGVDTFTAVNLLAFDEWPSSIELTRLIPFDATKWIFSICIILSFVNLGYEHIRAMRIMRRGSVAESFLDSLAVRLESVRLGSGQGWRRFLVFTELTKSKKGAEYVALFTYFSFQAWIRVIICSGPRQAVNALNLYGVYTSRLIPTETGSVDVTLMNFFRKIQALATENVRVAVILSGMLFTLVVWVFAALSLLLAALFYVFFLWHHIPKQDGGLSGYCERKINKRLMAIVTKKVNKAIAKEERDRLKAELRAAKKTGVVPEKPMVGRQATLPTFMDDSKGDALPAMPELIRKDTMASLSSRPDTPGSIEMSSFDQKRPLPTRQGTSNTFTSQSSYSSRAGLLGGASPMGMDRIASPAPTLPQIDLNNYPPVRPGTSQSNRSFGPAPPLYPVQTGGSSTFGASYTSSPSTYSPDVMPTIPSLPPPIRSTSVASSADGYGRPMPRAVDQLSGRPGARVPVSRSTLDDSGEGRSSPAPTYYSEPGFPGRSPLGGESTGGRNAPVYLPYRSASANPEAASRQPPYPPQRNMTAPMPQRQYTNDEYFDPRPGTPSSYRGPPRSDSAYDRDLEAQRRPPRY